MIFSISKKDLMLYSTIVVLIMALLGTFLVYKVQAQEEKENSKTQIETGLVLGEENSQIEDSNEGIPSGSTIQHMSCATEIERGNLPTSEVYNPNTPYNLSAFSSGAYFQDVNGDNLPDYVFVSHNVVGIGDSLNVTYKGCLLLNNGNGWAKEHVCMAVTNQDLVTGEFTTQEYRGDCAGTASLKQEN